MLRMAYGIGFNSPATAADAAIKLHEIKVEQSSATITTFWKLLHIFFDNQFKLNKSIMSGIECGHTNETYVSWINSQYYGDNGWADNTSITNISSHAYNQIVWP
jgi:hypothetical protein